MNWLELQHKLRQHLRRLWLSLCTDTWRKFFALLLGFICWYYVYSGYQGKNNEWRTIANLPVALREHPEFYLPRQENLAVELKIAVDNSARRGVIDPDDFRLEINPARLPLPAPEESNFLQQPYKVTLKVDEHIKRKPPGIRALSFDPPEVEIYFDRRLQVQKKIYVPIQGRLREGFEYRYVLSQDIVTVEGPASELTNLMQVYSDPLLLNDSMQHDFSTQLGIVSPDSSKFNIFPDKVEVKVSIEDQKSIISKKFSSVRLSLLTASHNQLQLRSQLPDSVEVILRGQREPLNALQEEQLSAFLDLTHLIAPGTYDELPVQFMGLPAEIRPIFIKPEKFILTLAPSPEPMEEAITPTAKNGGNTDRNGD